jgi:hypothetical protein
MTATPLEYISFEETSTTTTGTLPPWALPGYHTSLSENQVDPTIFPIGTWFSDVIYDTQNRLVIGSTAAIRMGGCAGQIICTCTIAFSQSMTQCTCETPPIPAGSYNIVACSNLSGTVTASPFEYVVYGTLPTITTTSITTITTTTGTTLPPKLYLDLGNDTTIDWTDQMGAGGTRRILGLSDNVYGFVRGGCWCMGCLVSGDGSCLVPSLITSDMSSNFTVNTVDLMYHSSRILGAVPYYSSFRRSEGGCWEIQDSNNVRHLVPVPPSRVCATADFAYNSSNHTAPVTDDAVNNAVFRLLNETLDVSPRDGRIDMNYTINMSIDAEGKIGVQSLWGPLEIRLVVWS